MSGFHFSKLVFRLQYQKSGMVPEFKTSALRGGMGQMLLRMFCVCPERQEKECETCSCRGRCIVQNIMYAPFRTRPEYVTEKESAGFTLFCGNERNLVRKGDVISFEMVLFGDMVAYFYPILQAFHMLGMEGLGHDRIPFSIERVENRHGEAIVDGMDIHNDRILIEDSSSYVEERRHETGLEENRDLRLCFLSPCEIKYRGEALREFQPEGVIAAIDRRVRMRSMFEGIEADDISYDIPSRFRQKCVQQVVKRHSGRQEDDIKLRGISGWMDIYDVDDKAIDLLIQGELTGIGKNTKFGFGKYYVERIHE